MRLKRRELLGGLVGGATAMGFSRFIGSDVHRALADRSGADRNTTGAFNRCLVLWMDGGPSQLDTFDPKSGGPRASIKTSVDSVRFAESLPGLAKQAHDLCLIRSVGSDEGEHTRATELMHTGYAPVPSFPRPAIGSMVAQPRPDAGFPRYVTLGGTGFGPAFLGTKQSPFVIDDIDSAREQLDRIASNRGAMRLLRELNKDYATSGHSVAAASRSGAIESVGRLLETPFPEALNLGKTSENDRKRYGDHLFGRRVLVARRLLQLGVPFVEAQLTGWDTHIDNDRRTGELCRQLEQPWLALMEDLKQNGLWEDTLIVWMGEFGRTPRLNGRAGRDHFPAVTPVVLAGGNLGGNVIGETSENGGQRIGEKHSVADLLATVLTLMGIDIERGYTTSFGSPTSITDDGTPIAQLTQL